MRKQVIAKLAGLGLTSAMLLGGMTVFADELVINQDTDLVANPAMVTVIADVGGQYTVTIPKELVLTLHDDGSYQCDYTVDVDGTIADTAYVSVIPQQEITISTTGKDDVPVTVTQGIKYFRSSTYAQDLSGSVDTTKIDASDAAPEAIGNLKVKDGYTLTSGKWEGTLLFDIALNWDTPASGN